MWRGEHRWLSWPDARRQIRAEAPCRSRNVRRQKCPASKITTACAIRITKERRCRGKWGTETGRRHAPPQRRHAPHILSTVWVRGEQNTKTPNVCLTGVRLRTIQTLTTCASTLWSRLTHGPPHHAHIAVRTTLHAKRDHQIRCREKKPTRLQ